MNIFMENKQWSLDLGGRELIISTGLLAHQANGSVTAQYGDTVVLATAVMSKSASKINGYFPLMVDFEERQYAAGKIKGSRFMKREGRPSDESVLAGRAVDRTIRPLFNPRMRNEVQVIVTTLSYDKENSSDVVAMIAASAALSISDIPWNGPIGAVKVGYINNQFVLNPTISQKTENQLDLLLAGTESKVNMLEVGAQEIPEEILAQAFDFGFESIQKIATFISSIQQEIGKTKAQPALLQATPEFEAEIKQLLLNENLAEALYLQDKKTVYENLDAIQAKVSTHITENYPDHSSSYQDVAKQVFEEVSDEIVHENILTQEKRPDGRALTQVRPIHCKTGLLPRTHGSGLFTRGETQALTITTLGAPGDEQTIDTMETDTKKRYIHHYNFPPYSVGEVRPMRGPGRREIGHGALAEKALIPVLPEQSVFPYTIMLVSEVLASNGSSSMASTCGSTLSLMDAGVPIKAPVSGIAMGIIIGKNNSFKVLTDIQGLEDHYGDMDFKAAGTQKGVTAAQMDVKVDGVTLDMLKAVLLQSKANRKEILDIMLAEIASPREDLSMHAPRILTLHINPEKIRDVIGPGGKMINQIIDETGVAIDIEDDGSVFITSSDKNGAQTAMQWIMNLTKEVSVGEAYSAKITRIMNFGAFAEFLPNQEGLIHISELSHDRVEKVSDKVAVGDTVQVQVKEIDNQGRINLTMKL